jgi:hypothetical protein
MAEQIPSWFNDGKDIQIQVQLTADKIVAGARHPSWKGSSFTIRKGTPAIVAAITDAFNEEAAEEEACKQARKQARV